MDKPEIHVSTPSKQHSRRSWLTGHAKVIIGVVVVVVVAAAAIVALQPRQSKEERMQFETKLAQSDAAFEKGKYAEALNTLHGALELATTKNQKAEVYDRMAAAAASGGKVKEAISYYEQKHKVAPKTAGSDAYILGTLYERVPDKAKAIEQFKGAITFYKTQPQDSFVQAQIMNVEARITDLEAQP